MRGERLVGSWVVTIGMSIRPYVRRFLALIYAIQSILSILGSILPAVLDVPPTLPRLPSRQASRSGDDREGAVTVSVTPRVETVYTGDSSNRDMASSSAEGLARAAKSNDIQRVRFADGRMRQPQSLPLSSHETEPPSEWSGVYSPISSPGELPDTGLPSPSLSNGSSDSGSVPRGRRLSFIRRRFSQKFQGYARATPANGFLAARNHLLTPPNSAPTSPMRSPERPDPFEESAPSGSVKRCSKKRSSEISGPKTPVPRTDPYQAPYFFPSPLSPEADGYVDRVRSERVLSLSPERRRAVFSPISSPAASPPGRMVPLPPVESSSPGAGPSGHTHEAPTSETAPEENILEEEHADPHKKSSWHFPFPHHRPASWGSDVPTSESSGSGSGPSVQSPSNARPRLKNMWRRSSGSQQMALSSLSPTRDSENVASSPSPTAKSRKSWLGSRFHHERSASDVSRRSRSSNRQASELGELSPATERRPELRETR
ncbi:hypothetical protein PHLCEN_2v2752 [Hermanssonia centrifuga]|uniref:Uncharacterized protein n=1 Tax=Hermanssonia centrifuga TaxID=98765 RepID=A0A2R6RHV1_9APHY|nr:hypothetical protein PHLCEN_2v2752 [Hermanssonia centrifuga]